MENAKLILTTYLEPETEQREENHFEPVMAREAAAAPSEDLPRKAAEEESLDNMSPEYYALERNLEEWSFKSKKKPSPTLKLT